MHATKEAMDRYIVEELIQACVPSFVSWFGSYDLTHDEMITIIRGAAPSIAIRKLRTEYEVTIRVIGNLPAKFRNRNGVYMSRPHHAKLSLKLDRNDEFAYSLHRYVTVKNRSMIGNIGSRLKNDERFNLTERLIEGVLFALL